MKNMIAGSTAIFADKKRSSVIDIARGLCMLLIVWTYAQAPFSSLTIQFYIPAFFVIAGLAFKVDKPFKEFCVEKLRCLYVPFVVLNLAAFIPKLIVKGFTLERVRNLFYILIMGRTDGSVFGATWFLAALFFCGIAYKLLHMFFNGSVRLVTAVLAVAGGFGYAHVLDDDRLSKLLICMAFFALGYLLNVYSKHIDFNLIGAALCLVIAVGFGWYLSEFVVKGVSYKNLLTVPVAAAAAYVIIYAAGLLEDKLQTVGRAAAYLGRAYKHIIIWMILAFKPVTAVQLALEGKSVTKAIGYYPVYNTRGAWGLLYVIVGIAVPLVIARIVKIGALGKFMGKFKEQDETQVD